MGMLMPWAMDWEPAGWALCDGRLMQIEQHQELFTLLGTKYGGDGETTFALPDLRGRVPVGMGQQGESQVAPYVLGSIGGAETTKMRIENLPPHTHSVTGNVTVNVGAPANTGEPTTNVPAANTSISMAIDSTGANANIYNTNAPTMMIATIPSTATVSGTTDSAGDGEPIHFMQPYQVVNYIIAILGIYPKMS